VIKKYDIEIYNRWGELIFQSSDENLGWDGKDKKGNSSGVGTYHYRIQFKDPKEKVTSLSGIIHLIR
jgi:gliding motility-associated-like protein